MPGHGRKQDMNIDRTALQIQKIADDFNTRLIAPVSSHRRNPNQSRNNGAVGSYGMMSRYLSFWKQSGGNNSTGKNTSKSLLMSPKKK